MMLRGILYAVETTEHWCCNPQRTDKVRGTVITWKSTQKVLNVDYIKNTLKLNCMDMHRLKCLVVNGTYVFLIRWGNDTWKSRPETCFAKAT